MRTLLAALAAALLLGGCVAPSEVAGPGEASATDSPGDVDEQTEPDTYRPTRADFKPMLKVTSRQCFGSAGCNIEYRVGLRWVGEVPAPRLDGRYDIYFRLTGSDFGPSTETITVSPRMRYSPVEGYSSTGSVGDRLGVKILRVEPAGGF